MSTVGPTIPTGTQGSTGPQGNTGARGYTGSQGVAGTVGSTGLQGNQGKTGSQGSQGSTGLQGNQGSTGVGTVGATGLQGNQGSTGSQGSQGPAGTGGSGTGITGLQGNQGATGSVGADGTYSMTCAPPAILFSAVTATSKYIYIPWTYPTQIVAGSLGCYLPLITSVTCAWSLIVNGTTTNQPILSAATGNTNVRYNGTVPYTTWITGLVLTNVISAASPSYQSLVFPGETVARNCFVYYSSNFANMTSTSTNTVTAYYSNYNTTSNQNTCNFSIFLSAGVPSTPLAPAFSTTTLSGITGVSGTTTNNTIYGTGTNYIDLGSTGSNTYAAANYKYTYSTPGSMGRYGGQVGHTGSQTGLSGTQTISGLYPDSVYSLYESVQNNSTNTNYSAISQAYSFTSVGIAPTQSFGSITSGFAVTTTSAKLVAANGSGDLINAPVSVIFGSPTPLTSNGFKSPIHCNANRGSTGTSLLNISCSAVRGSTGIAGASSTISYNGFPAAASLVGSTGPLMAISSATATDSFATSVSQFQGFYLQTGNHALTLNSGIFTPSNDKTTVNLNQTQYPSSGVTGAISNSSFSFYYDVTPSATPSIGTFASTLKTVTTFSVSGVNAFYGSIVFNATTPTSNIGNYYYRNGNIVSYYVGGSVVANETTLANISTVSSPLAVSNTFTNTGSPAISYTPSLFATSIAIYAVAYNCVGTASLNSNTVTLTAIFDPMTRTLLTNTAQYPVAYTSGNAYTGIGQSSNNPGRRIVSGQTNGSIYGNDSLTFVSALPAAAIYANSPYDNTQIITNSSNYYNQELQMVNGLYVTKGYSGATCYVDYSTYLNNSVNYSGIGTTGYRYATFAWKCATNASNYSKITFAINGFTQPITTPATIPQSGSQTMQMFYRIEDAANPSTSSSNFSAAYRNTTWLNVYGEGVNPVLSANYHLYSNIYSAQNTSLTNTYSSNTLTTYVLTPSFAIGSSDNVYIYLRIGLPMTINLGFSYVTAALS